MKLKRQFNSHQLLMILTQMGVLGLSMALVFWLMVLGNREKIEGDLKARLDASTQAMAAQLKANQVPFSGTNVEPGVFIINQTDGTVVIDRRNGGDAAQKLWEGYKTKIIYEMQKQKRGWIQYPDKGAWSLNEPQRIIRYTSIDELNWILALEDVQPSSLDLIKKSVNPLTCGMILLIFIAGSGIIWFVSAYYFGLMKRQISASLEDDLLSLNGEEKLWGKAHGQMPKVNEPDKESGLEFSTPKSTATTPSVSVADPIMEEIFHQQTSAKPISPAVPNIVLPTKEAPKAAPKEMPKAPPAKNVEQNDQTVDVEHIHSPVLKKMLQQFRDK